MEVGLVCTLDVDPFSEIEMDLTAFASGVLILVAAARARCAASAAAPAVAESVFSSDLDCVFGERRGDMALGDLGECEARCEGWERGASDFTLIVV